jgi:hypothetical protein
MLKDWVAKLGEDGLQDRISLDEIAQIRIGNYKDANPDVQRK